MRNSTRATVAAAALLAAALCAAPAFGEPVLQHGLYGLRVRLRSADDRRHVLHVKRDRSAWTGGDIAHSRDFARRSTFRVAHGLSGYATVAFESPARPGHYLRPHAFTVTLRAYRHSDAFRKEASFVVHPGLFGSGGVSFESVRRPGHFLRRFHDAVRISPLASGARFQRDATWFIEQPVHHARR